MIKKLLSVTMMLALVAGASAQQVNAGVPHMVPVSAANIGYANVTATTIDTLRPVSVMPGGCGVSGSLSGLYYYNINNGTGKDSGYYFGTGKFPQAGATVTALAQKYAVGASAATITNVLVLAGVAHGTTTTTMATIYSVNASKAPNASLGASTAIPMSAYSSTNYTKFTFGTPVAVAANSSFFAAISVPAFGGADKDTLALLDTQGGCSSTDSLSWVQFNSAVWIPVTRVFGPTQNLDLMIFPVLNISNGINDFVSKGDLSLYAASPNPATNSININFGLNNTSKIEIEVYDMTGKVVKSFQSTDSFTSGKNTISLDLSTMANGTYMYSVNSNGNKMFSKFVVIK
jgi:hypothetical protein